MYTFLIFNNCMHLNNVLPQGQLCRLRPHHRISVPDLRALNVTLFRCRDDFFFFFVKFEGKPFKSVHCRSDFWFTICFLKLGLVWTQLKKLIALKKLDFRLGFWKHKKLMSVFFLTSENYSEAKISQILHRGSLGGTDNWYPSHKPAFHWVASAGEEGEVGGEKGGGALRHYTAPQKLAIRLTTLAHVLKGDYWQTLHRMLWDVLFL